MIEHSSSAAWRRLRRLLLLAGLGALAACQHGQPPVAAPDGWQVVERVGGAGFRTGGAGPWTPAMAGGAVPAGSRVATGMGGRVILARDGDQIIAGTAADFVLPETGSADRVRQTHGVLRYRLTRDRGPLRVETAALLVDGEADTVFDLAADGDGAQVAVVRGRVRLATPDGLHGAVLEAGQSAYARPFGPQRLTVRKVPGGPVEAVPAIVEAIDQGAAPEPAVIAAPAPLPAVATADAAADAGAPALAAAAAPSAPVPAPDLEAEPRVLATTPAAPAAARGSVRAQREVAPAMAGRARDARSASAVSAARVTPSTPDWAAKERRDLVVVPATYPKRPGARPPEGATPTGTPPSGEVAPGPQPDDAPDDPKAEIRRRFERLTDGLLDRLPPARLGQP